jgi:thiol-disulfide isomerase/thioredoxin
MKNRHSIRALFLIPLLWLGLALDASAFSVTDTKGKLHSLAGYKGKWVLVNFWATWCPPCIAEMPDLSDLHENKQNNLVVIGIALDWKDAEHVKRFAESMLVSYPIVLGNYEMANQFGRIEGLPTTYLYNPAGKRVAYNVGPLTREAVERYIKAKKGV